MLTAEQIDNLPNETVDEYNEFELLVMLYMADLLDRNYVSSKFSANLIKHSIKMFNFTLANIPNTTKSVSNAFQTGISKSDSFDTKIAKKAGKTIKSLKDNDSAMQIINANIKVTNGDLVNLTRTTAVQSQQLFIRSATLAQKQIEAGVATRAQAVSNAIKSASREGLTVQYPSGAKRSLESAVRNAVGTGINQTAGEITEQRVEEFETNLVETSAHEGARNTGEGFENHEKWQGQVFEWVKGEKKTKYPDFQKVTGYKISPLGLLGYGCRHSFYPYFQGLDKQYTQQQLNELNKTVEYNGQTISSYDANQKLRHIERMIRRWKTESKMLESIGQENTFAKGKIKAWQAKARDLTKQTGVRRKYEREKIA